MAKNTLATTETGYDLELPLPVVSTPTSEKPVDDLGFDTTEKLVAEMLDIITGNTQVIQDLLQESADIAIAQINAAHQESLQQIEAHYQQQIVNLQLAATKCANDANISLQRKIQQSRLTLSQLRQSTNDTNNGKVK